MTGKSNNLASAHADPAASRAEREALIVAPHANLKLSAHLVPVIAPMMAVNDIRYFLNGINVRPHAAGGAVICATNGSMLAVIYDRNAVCDVEVTVRIDAHTVVACTCREKAARKLMIQGGRLTVIDKDGDEIHVQPGQPLVDGQFPDYGKFFPGPESLKLGLLANIDSSLIAAVDKSAKAYQKAFMLDNHSRGLAFFNVDGDPKKPAVARLGGSMDYVAVLMPIRIDQIGDAIPAWLAATKAQVAQ